MNRSVLTKRDVAQALQAAHQVGLVVEARTGDNGGDWLAGYEQALAVVALGLGVALDIGAASDPGGWTVERTGPAYRLPSGSAATAGDRKTPELCNADCRA